MTGRPSSYTPEIAQAICDRLSEGEPLAEICRDKGMPHPSTVRDWANKNEALSLAIADARENGEERITANIRRTARGETGYSTGDVQRDKLVVDTDLKLLAKWNPKKYGDKTDLTVNGNLGITALTDEQLASQLKQALSLAGVAGAGAGNGEAEK